MGGLFASSLTFALTLLLSLGQVWAGDVYKFQKSVPVIEATLDYTQPELARNSAFHDAIEAQVGKTVYLKLTIIPRDADSYSLIEVQPSQELAVTCGTAAVPGGRSEIGYINDTKYFYRLGFHNALDFHGPVTVIISNRLKNPYQELKCSIRDYLNTKHTDVIIRGFFRVYSSDIPTAIKYDLYPVPSPDLR